MVRKLVVASGFFSRDGADQAFWNGFAIATLDIMPKELRDGYLSNVRNAEKLSAVRARPKPDPLLRRPELKRLVSTIS